MNEWKVTAEDYDDEGDEEAETEAILSDPDTMAAIAEGESEINHDTVREQTGEDA